MQWYALGQERPPDPPTRDLLQGKHSSRARQFSASGVVQQLRRVGRLHQPHPRQRARPRPDRPLGGDGGVGLDCGGQGVIDVSQPDSSTYLEQS
jgi:hypothetical protein